MRSAPLALAALTLAGLTSLAAPAAHAQSLTYVLTGTANGTVVTGGITTPFLNQTFTFTETAPISGIITNGGYMVNPAGTVNLVLGSNSGTVANYGAAVSNVAGTVAEAGFLNSTTLTGVLGVTTTAGPVTLSAPQSPVALQTPPNNIVPTSFGSVDFVTISTLTFSSASAAVPEPGSLALLTGLSLTGAAFLRRRKQIQKAA